MKLTPEERNLQARIFKMYVETLVDYTNSNPPSPQVNMAVQEMIVIRSIMKKILKTYNK